MEEGLLLAFLRAALELELALLLPFPILPHQPHLSSHHPLSRRQSHRHLRRRDLPFGESLAVLFLPLSLPWWSSPVAGILMLFTQFWAALSIPSLPFASWVIPRPCVVCWSVINVLHSPLLGRSAKLALLLLLDFCFRIND